VRRKLAVRKFVNSSGFNELLFFASTSHASSMRLDSISSAPVTGPDREAISSNAGASQNSLLGHTQLFKLHLDQLLQRFCTAGAIFSSGTVSAHLP